MRFVIAKNSESPEITTQSTPTPSPRAYPSRVPSISATPPPFAVELTLTMRRAPTRPEVGGRGEERRQALLANDRLQPARVERHDVHRIAR